jgi:hypothetical protein
MNQIKYGQFLSEKDNPQWENIRRFSVVLARDDFHLMTNFVNYGNSCHFSDVGIHFHKEDGDKCIYSPTGFCSCYDQIRWDSFGNSISDKVALEILIERIQKALESNNSGLTDNEEKSIRKHLKTFELWEG